MPRVALTMEQKVDYKLLDFKYWVMDKMNRSGMTQTDIGKALGLSQPQVCQKLKVPDKKKRNKVKLDTFSYKQALFFVIYLRLQTKKRYGC